MFNKNKNKIFDEDFFQTPPKHKPSQTRPVLTERLQHVQKIGGRFLVTFFSFLLVSGTIFSLLFVAVNYSAYSERLLYWWKAMSTQLPSSNELLLTHKASQSPAIQSTFQDNKIHSLGFTVSPPDDRIIIPKIAKNVNIVYATTRGNDAILDQLSKGAVHYPDTALPGEIGNVFITGHSSYLPWDKGNYNTVFALLDKLVIGDDVVIYRQGKKFTYKVFDMRVTTPQDLSPLEQPDDKRMLTLMTCTPVGTDAKRLIVQAYQQEITTSDTITSNTSKNTLSSINHIHPAS